MCPIWLVFFFLCASQLLCFAQAGRRIQQTKVYVWNFQSNIRDRELIDSITDEFETAVVKTKRFDVLERRSLARLLKQQEAEASNVLNLNILDRETLQAKGAQAVFFGKVFNDGASGHVRITVILESFDTSILWKSDVLMRPPELRDAEVRTRKLEQLLPGYSAPSQESTSHPELPVSEEFRKAVSLDNLEIEAGTFQVVPGTAVRGVSFQNAVYFDREKLVIRLHKKYKLLTLRVGIDDRSKGSGGKHFWVFSRPGRIPLFDGTASPNVQPVLVAVDVSNAESIELTAVDYNGQSPVYVRWIDLKVVPK